MLTSAQIPPSVALRAAELITPTAHGIASRVLAKTSGGNVTLFAFAARDASRVEDVKFSAIGGNFAR